MKSQSFVIIADTIVIALLTVLIVLMLKLRTFTREFFKSQGETLRMQNLRIGRLERLAILKQPQAPKETGNSGVTIQ